MTSKTTKLLFLCTGNSCRSQMAEGWAHHLKKDVIEAYSAGIEKHGLNPYAVEVMKEVDIDISGQKSTTLEQLGINDFDVVLTVCSDADDNCPQFSFDTKVIHQGFEDQNEIAKSNCSSY